VGKSREKLPVPEMSVTEIADALMREAAKLRRQPRVPAGDYRAAITAYRAAEYLGGVVPA
jgi:hypothetical protein